MQATDDRILLDVPALAAALSRRLYAAGLPVTPERAVTFADALMLMGPLTRSQLYCTARTVFVSAPGHLPDFDRVFGAVFDPCPAADEEQARASRAGRLIALTNWSRSGRVAGGNERAAIRRGRANESARGRRSYSRVASRRCLRGGGQR